jgi:hypothetical protein
VARWLFETLTVAVATIATAVPATAAHAGTLPSRDQWLADTAKAMYGSRAYVGDRVEQGGTKLAANFDIDNTSLQTRYAPGRPVPAVLRFAKYATAHGVTLLFNTGRERTKLRGITRQLRAAGYAVTEVCGRRSGESLTHSKQRCRQHFVDEGYTIIANVGNRDTDLVGGDYERGFKLPDYGKLLS